MLGTGLRMLIRRERGPSGPLLGNDQLYNVIVSAHAFVIIFFMVIAILIRGVGELTATTNIGAPEMTPLG